MSNKVDKKKKNKYKGKFEHPDKARINEVIRGAVSKELEAIKREAAEKAVDTTMTLTLTLPLKILIDQGKDAEDLEKFADELVDMYDKYVNGELDIQKLKKEVWDKVGLRIEENK